MKINFNKSKYKYNNIINQVFDHAEQILDVKELLEVNITLVSARKIKKLNKQFRQVDKVTDVLSFPTLLNQSGQKIELIESILTKENFANDINPEGGAIFLGDIVVCLKKVKKQSKQFHTTFLRELNYLSLHGLLHLFGYDHIENEDKKIMRKREEQILSKFDF